MEKMKFEKLETITRNALAALETISAETEVGWSIRGKESLLHSNEDEHETVFAKAKTILEEYGFNQSHVTDDEEYRLFDSFFSIEDGGVKAMICLTSHYYLTHEIVDEDTYHFTNLYASWAKVYSEECDGYEWCK